MNTGRCMMGLFVVLLLWSVVDLWAGIERIYCIILGFFFWWLLMGFLLRHSTIRGPRRCGHFGKEFSSHKDQPRVGGA